ncbi:hypothetical protein D3C87_1671070 [compost metagenome]
MAREDHRSHPGLDLLSLSQRQAGEIIRQVPRHPTSFRHRKWQALSVGDHSAGMGKFVPEVASRQTPAAFERCKDPKARCASRSFIAPPPGREGRGLERIVSQADRPLEAIAGVGVTTHVQVEGFAEGGGIFPVVP